MHLRHRLHVLAAILVAAVVLVAGPIATADARKVAVRVGATLTCTPKPVYVRLADGTVKQVNHVEPGPLRSRIGRQASNLYILVRISASWSNVKTSPGTTIRLTADGPRQEQWRWTFRLVSSNPERDPSSYVACLRPKAGAVSFVRRLRKAHGKWLFSVQVTEGRLKGSRGAVSVRSA